MSRYLKRLISIIVTIILLVSMIITVSAEDVYTPLSKIKKYIEDNSIQPTSLNETILYRKTQILSSSLKDYLVITDENDSIQISEMILALIATNNDPSNYNGKNYCDMLKQKQKENGSFDDSFEATAKAIVATNAAKITISDENAASFILSFQKDDGSFSASEDLYYDTYLAVSALSIYSSENKAIYSLIEKAKTFIKNVQNDGILPVDNLKNTAYAVLIVTDANDVAESNDYGNLVKSLLRFQNVDGTFRKELEDDTVFEKESTILALKALEAVRYGACDYKALGINHSFETKFDFEGFKPFLIGYGIVALLSVIMWIVVLSIKKKKTNTLEEYKEETLKDVPVASPEDTNIS